MSQDPGVAASPGVELLLRLVAEQLRTSRCVRCGESLAGSRVTLRDRGPQQVVVEVACAGCDAPQLLRVEPEAKDGIAGVR